MSEVGYIIAIDMSVMTLRMRVLVVYGVEQESVRRVVTLSLMVQRLGWSDTPGEVIALPRYYNFTLLDVAAERQRSSEIPKLNCDFCVVRDT